MERVFFSALMLSVMLISACNNSDNTSEKNVHDMDSMGNDSMEQMPVDGNTVAEIKTTFTNVDASLAESLKTIVAHYLHIKNALANDDGKEASNGANNMGAALSAIDKSLFTPEQKKVFDDVQEGLKEHAAYISQNDDNIKQQREHFALMSESVYAIVKAFGVGMPIYHDHCPMYNDQKGAMWLSETKEVKNPYFGKQMPDCGKVEEVIK